jgi:hypothetical protein
MFFGLIQNTSAVDSYGSWYWVDGKHYNPSNVSDERYFVGGLQLLKSQTPAAGEITYGYNATSLVKYCDAWKGVNYTAVQMWSLWEIPRILHSNL